MSTILLIVVGLVAGIALLIGIGYLLEKYGVTGKIKETIATIKGNSPLISAG